ncbi:MAG: hypothetical protein QXU11_10975 [Thermoproteota archaeon]
MLPSGGFTECKAESLGLRLIMPCSACSRALRRGLAPLAASVYDKGDKRSTSDENNTACFIVP